MKPVAWIKEQELAYMSAVAGLGMTEWKTNLGLTPEPGDIPLYTTPAEKRECLSQQEQTRSEKLQEAGYTRRPKGWSKDDPKPVAWMKVWRDGSKNLYDHEPPMFGKHETYALYTAPPKRDCLSQPDHLRDATKKVWVGLTGGEIGEEVLKRWPSQNTFMGGALWAEAKLKEKNDAA